MSLQSTISQSIFRIGILPLIVTTVQMYGGFLTDAALFLWQRGKE
jgi:hypothetical protein